MHSVISPLYRVIMGVVGEVFRVVTQLHDNRLVVDAKISPFNLISIPVILIDNAGVFFFPSCKNESSMRVEICLLGKVSPGVILHRGQRIALAVQNRLAVNVKELKPGAMAAAIESGVVTCVAFPREHRRIAVQIKIGPAGFVAENVIFRRPTRNPVCSANSLMAQTEVCFLCLLSKLVVLTGKPGVAFFEHDRFSVNPEVLYPDGVASLIISSLPPEIAVTAVGWLSMDTEVGFISRVAAVVILESPGGIATLGQGRVAIMIIKSLADQLIACVIFTGETRVSAHAFRR